MTTSSPTPLDGAALSLAWGMPFAGLLLSIAVMPLVAPKLWHAHYGKLSAAWALALVVPFAATFGVGVAAHEIVHAVLLDYLPFIAVLFALFTIAGGICVTGTLRGSPALNTGLLGLGAALASVMGTTGASMLLIRPLISANEGRRHRAHLVVFFILLVGNVGGALSPLGDPPLFIGFLRGVDFLWPTQALFVPTVGIVAALLAVFYVVDTAFRRRDPGAAPAAAKAAPAAPAQFRLEGAQNFVLLGAVVGVVLMSGLWRPGITIDVLGTPLKLQNLVREALLFALAFFSLAITPRAVREHNAFHWAPIVEVAKIFAGIFVTIIPVLLILGAGRDGAAGGLARLLIDANGTVDNRGLFLVCGLLSAFLDNAPTYLVFFDLAGGDAASLMGARSATLAAISMAAVYFGALTYVGNAPNFMIKAIAEDRGIAMPSFFAYIGWATLLLGPLLAAVAFQRL